jgi:hypothetical protein
MKRAVLYFPDERVGIEVRDLCVCMLNREYFLATGATPGEITDEVKESMIRTVCNARCKAYQQGRCQPTRVFSLSQG